MTDQCQFCVFGPKMLDKCEYYHLPESMRGERSQYWDRSGGVGRRTMKRRSCEGCVYYRPYSRSARGEWGCHYLFDTDQKRGCPVEGCTKKKVGIAKRRTDPFDGTIGR